MSYEDHRYLGGFLAITTPPPPAPFLISRFCLRLLHLSPFCLLSHFLCPASNFFHSPSLSVSHTHTHARLRTHIYTHACARCPRHKSRGELQITMKGRRARREGRAEVGGKGYRCMAEEEQEKMTKLREKERGRRHMDTVLANLT